METASHGAARPRNAQHVARVVTFARRPSLSPSYPMRLPKLLPFLIALLLAGCSAPREATVMAEVPATAPAEDLGAPPDEDPFPEAPAALREAPAQWYTLDATDDGVHGISLARAYEMLEGREPQREVVVAVIDSGVDIEHEDLAGMIWTNPGEVPGNGLDDDGNGYADDLHGWNFIGGPDGQNVEHDTYELTREAARLRERFTGIDPGALRGEERAEFERYERLRAEVERKRAGFARSLEQAASVEAMVAWAQQVLEEATGSSAPSPEAVAALRSEDPKVQQAQGLFLYLAHSGITPEDLAEQRAYLEARAHYAYNLDYDPRALVGDDYADTSERIYGNADVAGPEPSHGTGVAGVIAAVRGNGLGLDGIGGPAVRIMSVRAVPDGDERDKDVANAIRYAVDNGALVVNMSFGKGLSPQKEAVDAAVRHAEQRGVLLVHAAGNGSANIDTTANFPTPVYLNDTGTAANWLAVGATTWDDSFVASFSNFGAARVDLFAPGEDIDVLAPGDAYDRADGTSFAAPVVSGIAALLLSYFPELSPLEVRQILLDSAVPHHGRAVPRPGDGVPVDFGRLSATGGIVNAAEAVRLALERTGG